MGSRLQGKAAIVTGAAGGMGFAIARLFVDEGALVALVDIDGDRLADAARTIGRPGKKVEAFDIDISDYPAVARVVERVDEIWGRVDVLVNNAAIQSPGGSVVDASEEAWDRYLAVNVKGAGYFAKEVIPLMQRQGGGSIINIGSISGLVVFPRQAVYATTKGAMLQMTRAIAVDFGKDGIRANCICPGPTLSGPLASQASQEGSLSPALAELAKQHPLRRIALPEDIAYAALFLASDESRHITGVALPVDGGFTAR
jgi:dihydroanticapsin dehydrogenase